MISSFLSYSADDLDVAGTEINKFHHYLIISICNSTSFVKIPCDLYCDVLSWQVCLTTRQCWLLILKSQLELKLIFIYPQSFTLLRHRSLKLVAVVVCWVSFLFLVLFVQAYISTIFKVNFQFTWLLSRSSMNNQSCQRATGTFLLPNFSLLLLTWVEILLWRLLLFF